MQALIQRESLYRLVYLIRGHGVMMDRDLAKLYGVSTGVLNQAVKRNLSRFPADFMFQLSRTEMKNWMSQVVISNPRLKMGLRKAPYAFTEHGVAMLSSVLNSERAVQVSIAIVRVFIDLRRTISAHQDLARQIAEHEKKITGLTSDVLQIFDLIQPLLDDPSRKVERVGFRFDK